MALQVGNVKLQYGSPSLQNIDKQEDKSKFQVQKEIGLKNLVKQEGFLYILKEDDIIRFGKRKGDHKCQNISEVQFIKLSLLHIKNIASLGMCQSLTICILSSNFLQNIEPLQSCRNLAALDLHANQIEKLPSKSLWESLSKLHTLYLHDNGISRFEDVKNLAQACRLTILTLYDTPLSLKNNYRHCVVNAIWSLRCLDNCVVSDEEIIEDANFLPQYKPMQPHFCFKSCYLKKNKDVMSFGSAMRSIDKDLSTINRIQARWCPVLILQKMIRGFLTRLRFQYIMDTRLWAAVSIQRFYRQCKGLPGPPPPSPDAIYQNLSTLKLDYETYLKMRRSLHRSLLSFKSELRQDPYPCEPGKSKRYHISIDLDRLEAMTINTIDSKMTSLHLQPRQRPQPARRDTKVSSDARRIAFDLGLNQVPGDVDETVRDRTRVGRYYTQYKFLGEVIPSDADEEDDLNCDDDEEGSVKFRLNIRTPPTLKHDMLEEMVLRTIEGADDIRQAVRRIDEQRKIDAEPEPIRKPVRINNEQRLFLKTHGSMGLACFRAVDQAYKDRAKADELTRKSSQVKMMREQRHVLKQKRETFKRRYRGEAVVQGQADRVVCLDRLSEQVDDQVIEREKVAQKRLIGIKQARKAKENYRFAVEFRCQNASIGKALRNHDSRLLREELKERVFDKVNTARELTLKQRSVIQNYIEHSRLVKQTELVNSRTRLDEILARQAERRETQVNEFVNSKKLNHKKRLMTPTLIAIKEAQPLAHIDNSKTVT